MALEVHDLQSILNIDLHLICRAVFLASGEKNPDVSLSIVDDAAIHELNRRHLGHDRPTDVISFDYREGGEEKICGEVIVSAETALRVAGDRGLDPIAELVLYTIHGFLHLKGYDDSDPIDAAKMWQRQREIMNEMGWPGEIRS